MIRILVGTLGYVALFAAFLLLPAPSPIPWRAWLLLGVLLAVRVAGNFAVYRTHPALLREREGLPIQHGQPLIDRVLLSAFMASFGLLVSLASIDGLRLHLLGMVPSEIAMGGLALFIAGWLFVAYALTSNRFALLVVRAQDDQAVVTTGPYRLVRHPMYLGVVSVMVGMCLWLQSVLALVCTAIPTALLVARIVFEERFMLGRTPDYSSYCARVPYRLVPFVW